jgi:hypothetical protein
MIRPRRWVVMSSTPGGFLFLAAPPRGIRRFRHGILASRLGHAALPDPSILSLSRKLTRWINTVQRFPRSEFDLPLR